MVDVEGDDTADSGDEPRRFLPDGRPIATKRKKKKTPRNETDEGSEISVVDELRVPIELGGQVVVASDLNLQRNPTEPEQAAANELARRIETLDGTCALVFVGNVFAAPEDGQHDIAPILSAYPRFAEAVAAVAQKPGCRVIFCPGTKDHTIVSSDIGVRFLNKSLGAVVATKVDLAIATGTGVKRVHIEAGGTSLPADIEAGRTLAVTESAMFYQTFVKRFALFAVPLPLALVALIVGRILRLTGNRSAAHAADTWAASLALGSIAFIALGAMICVAWWIRARKKIGDGAPIRALDDDAGISRNNVPRRVAGRAINDETAGVITGSTGQAELTALGSGFYANPGCCGEAAVAREGRFGAPDAWTTEQRWSWLELEAGAQLHVRLLLGRRQLLTTNIFERLLTRSLPENDASARLTASWPHGEDWPVLVPNDGSRRRARRVAALLIAMAGLINLVSAVLPPFRTRLTAVREIVPLAIAEAAAMVVALSGLLLLLLARGVRRGQRHAWMVAVALLGASFGLHVVKGLDFEESIVAGVICLYLLANRRHFQVRADDVSVSRGFAVLGTGLFVAVATAVAAIKLVPGHRHPHLSWVKATQAAAERLVGGTSITVGAHTDRFLVPVMMAVTVGLVVYAGWLIFSPVLGQRLKEPEVGDEERAREIVSLAQGGTLAYFALRDDKRWFFSENTLVAYAVTQGVALVSPDPIGPVAERREAFGAFQEFADAHGWPIAVMGASEEWLPIYRAAGMREMYVGDEAVVDVRRFSLDGGRNKGLRQAVNRIANNGYTIEFHDPGELEESLEASLRALMTESRRGEMERGFSMTLGRIFDPRDQGLLLAVCRDPQGNPAAFCQYVPAPAINGYSLDLMRRSERGEHPNGLTDYVVAETITHLRAAGNVGLGLNFATMRATLAGERGDGTSRRLERWFYQKMSDSMQIESLWHYNAKFDPDWVPRYACYDTAENLLASATALAKAESWWEIPVIGRFFMPADASSGE